MADNKPSGRPTGRPQSKPTASGSVHKRGDGLGTGKVGNADFGGRFCYYTTLRHKDSADETDPYFVDLECYKGNYIIIKFGPARFTPYTGKPDLGFNK